MSRATDEFWMAQALAQARAAAAVGEVPVGAVLVADDALVAAAYNQSVSTHDATAHAEVQVLRLAGAAGKNHRLVDTTLYVTIEPCMMCAGALVHARIARLVYGALEPKAGAVHSHPQLNAPWLNHQLDVCGGVSQAACSQLMSDFFHRKRTQHPGSDSR